MALRVIDRCDYCGAQAFFLAMKAELDLLFCGHHGRQHLDALIFQGWDVADETEALNPGASNVNVVSPDQVPG
jgi:hypothetical protein